MNENLDQLIYYPNGDLNVPYVLANANLLIKSGDINLAATIFMAAAKNKKQAYCGYYGLGLCFVKLGKHAAAVQAFQKSFSLKQRPYIGVAWVEALIESGKGNEAEQIALQCGILFVNDGEASQQFRNLYLRAVELQKQKLPLSSPLG